MIKKTFEKLDTTGFGVFFEKALDSVFELFFEYFDFSLVINFIWKSFQVNYGIRGFIARRGPRAKAHRELLCGESA